MATKGVAISSNSNITTLPLELLKDQVGSVPDALGGQLGELLPLLVREGSDGLPDGVSSGPSFHSSI